MQRTVKSTRFTYVENILREDGKIDSTIKTIEVPYTDIKKASKEAFRKVGFFAILKTEQVENLWILDDETFFKYAHIATPNETTEKTDNE